VGYYPDNHRPQTPQELSDTIDYAINAWCDGVMKINKGRITLFDLIDEAIDTKSADIEPGIYDLKHSTEKIFWQDILGSENYAPVVRKVASEKFVEYGGVAEDLKFFISETGLEDQKTFNSLKYWIEKWDAKGAKIDGVNAKVTLSYSEDPTTQAANKESFDKLLDNLATLGKLIRISNFDITYKAVDGMAVTAAKITDEQRQNLANYYADLIKSYMTKIPNAQQAGICKGNMQDTSDPVGLWSVDSKSKDWVRTATYEAFCKALSGK
jgi:GH35 family endo-1,4-beta-xylanase